MKNQKSPTISVYMPVYNGNGFVSMAIESILSQTFKNFEFVIVDDGSTDDSWKTITKYAKKDCRIRTFRNKTNRGVSFTANFALTKCTGQFIARMDADDISFPTRLEKQLRFLKKNPDVVACGTQCLIINAENEVTGIKSFPTNPQELKPMAFYAIPMQQPSVMVNTILLPKNFTWYFDKRPYGEDVGFIFRLLQHGQIANLSEKLLFYRDTPNSLTKRKLRPTFTSTLLGRLQAVREGHRPSIKAILVNLAQITAVYLLPASAVFGLWNLIRGTKKTDLARYKVPSFSC
jgi:glycosyltransferase involved in cell wall biosynthesis